MIALQTRGAQLPDPAKATAQYANMMNMASQQRAAQLQGERTRQEMDFAKNAETRAVAGEQRNVDKFGVEQSKALVSALGTGIVQILRDPSDASIGQVGQTFTNVGLKQTQFGPLLKHIQDIPDANARKLFVMDLVAQSPEATATLKAVMPDLKESKVGNTTVFYDGNPNSANFGKPIFNITAPAEPTKMTQNVVDGTLMNTNPYTGVSAEAIAAGAFHNDVVAVANERVLFTHELAFANPEGTYAALRAALPEAEIVIVPASAVSLADAIASYLFNAQLLTLPGGEMGLIIPLEAWEHQAVRAWLDGMLASNGPIRRVLPVDVRQSMANGGGPACLRLRVVADPATVDPRFLLSEARADLLEMLIAKAWPEQIDPADIGRDSLASSVIAARAALLDALDLSALA
jgi:hypothetical protein